MASSRSQASKSPDKRKRDKTDHDESSHTKKRKHGLAAKADLANTPSKSRHMGHVEGVSVSNQKNPKTSAPEDILAKAKTLPKWSVSSPMGGRMSDIDSIFSADEKYTEF